MFGNPYVAVGRSGGSGGSNSSTGGGGAVGVVVVVVVVVVVGAPPLPTTSLTYSWLPIQDWLLGGWGGGGE